MSDDENDRVFVVSETRADTTEPMTHGVYATRELAETVRENKRDDDVLGQYVNVTPYFVQTEL